MKKVFLYLNFVFSLLLGYFSWDIFFNQKRYFPQKLSSSNKEMHSTSSSPPKKTQNPSLNYSLTGKSSLKIFSKKDLLQKRNFINKFIKVYQNLRPNLNVSPTKFHDPYRDTLTAKLNLLSMIEIYLRDKELDENERLKLVEFHKNALNEEKSFFLRRQIIRNLNKIIKFENESAMEEYLASVDKRVLHLSRFNLLELTDMFLRYAP